MPTRELPRDMDPADDDETAGQPKDYAVLAHSEMRPDTALEALMRAAPHEPIDASGEELLPLREIICDAIDELSEEEQYLFNMLYSERLSVREIGYRLALSKSNVTRQRDKLNVKMQHLLQRHPTIRRYLNGQ